MVSLPTLLEKGDERKLPIFQTKTFWKTRVIGGEQDQSLKPKRKLAKKWDGGWVRNIGRRKLNRTLTKTAFEESNNKKMSKSRSPRKQLQ